MMFNTIISHINTGGIREFRDKNEILRGEVFNRFLGSLSVIEKRQGMFLEIDEFFIF